ncbi:Outer membrane protein TolC [Sulfurivirga caldicuralii]|uniref:Outer membrane protein TolC n=1 Tax=Sulfurivirga caldicuralii TaxID=364032 RepID=A0A1N6GNV2_9GAMM|nr:TolC family protein [Sulfurivirga caldicuralii]SIO09216.1 Outer membrane protein TolC [Sulfurivirga caldicuralii]
MKLRPLVAAVALSLPLWAQAEVLSLKACVQQALQNNPEIAAADGQIQQAAAALKAAKRSRLPQINLELNVINSNDALNVFGMKLQERRATFNDFGANEFTGPSALGVKPKNLNQPGDWTHYNGKLQLLIPIWNGGKISGFQDQAGALMEAAQYGKEAVRQFLAYNVFRAYDAVHTARAYIEVSKKALKAAESYVKTTRNLVEEGVVVKAELLRAEVHRSEAALALETAQNQEQLALAALRTLLALDESHELDVAQRVKLELPSEDVAEMVSMALSDNPKLKAMRKQYEADLAEVKIARADKYPHLNMLAEENAYSDHAGLGEYAYTVAAQAKWKLTDFGVTDAAVSRMRAKASTRMSKLASAENQTRLEVIQAWRKLKIANRRILTTDLNQRQAQEANRLIRKRYEAGISTITELLASQAQLDKARADHVAAIYDANIQKAKLRLLTGTMTPDSF